MGIMRDDYIDRIIGERLLAKNVQERAKRTPSGKLSASMLGQPLQWQVLKHIGVPQREIDEYVIRKFQRGKDIEDWLIGHIEPVETQKFVEYRDCIGYVDALVDTKNHDFKLGVIPHEVKSVTNMKFKRIQKQNEPDNGNILQACLYALGVNSKHFAIDYVASDDLRVMTYVFETETYKEKVDEIISRYTAQIEKGVVPLFEYVEKWQSNKLYCSYPDWMTLEKEITFEEAKKLINTL